MQYVCCILMGDIICYCSFAAGLMRMLQALVHSLSLHLLMNVLLMMHLCYPQASV
jgi:hypothetical protein